MDSRLQIINPITYNGWDDLLLSSRISGFFCSSIWARVIVESYKYKPLYFTELVDAKISSLVPLMEISSVLTGKRGVSLPFTDYSEPILDQETEFLSLIDKLIRYGKESDWRYIELRGGKAAPGIASLSSYYVHTLKLNKNGEETFKSFRSSTKRNIKKAAKEGVDIRLSNSVDSVKEFYRLNCLTRKKHGLPPQPFYFFKKIFDHVLSKNAGFVVLASYQENTIAASVFFHFGKKAIYKYGASDSRYQHLRANNLVMWEAIKWYCDNGYESFSFGRTEPENKGLLQFKSGWGAHQEIINYYKYDLSKQIFVTNHRKGTGLSNKVFNRMPIPLLRLIGTILYPHVG